MSETPSNQPPEGPSGASPGSAPPPPPPDLTAPGAPPPGGTGGRSNTPLIVVAVLVVAAVVAGTVVLLAGGDDDDDDDDSDESAETEQSSGSEDDSGGDDETDATDAGGQSGGNSEDAEEAEAVVRRYFEAVLDQDCEEIFATVTESTWSDNAESAEDAVSQCEEAVASGQLDIEGEATLDDLTVTDQGENSVTFEAAETVNGEELTETFTVVVEDGEWRIDLSNA